MKKQLFSMVFIALAAILNAQTFAPIGAKWHYNSQGQGAGSSYYLYESVLDTAVAGRSCKKIKVTYFPHYGGIVYQNPVFTYQSNDTVFYYNNAYARYFPLYIFNVSAGDTMTYHSLTVPNNAADTTWKSIVDSVTNFIVGTDTLKRVWTHEPNVYALSYWGGYIERLGCPFLMLPQPHMIYPEWDGPLRCYADSSISYNFSLAVACDAGPLSVGLNEISQETGISIFPNPANNFITIKMTSNNFTQYKIYNVLGQPILSGQLASTTSIALDNLDQGMYVIELTTNNVSKQQSFVVSR